MVNFIKKDPKRNKWVKDFLQKLKGPRIALYQHTEHGELIYENITGIEVKTIKGDFARQKKLGVFFLYGKTPSRTRKLILDYVKNLKGTEDVLIIGQFKLLSTGINIKPLKHIVFLSSTKSNTTIIQSVGRVLRLHGSKTKAIIWDLVDNFSDHRQTENHSLKHFWHRLGFYEFQQFEIHERNINLS